MALPKHYCFFTSDIASNYTILYMQDKICAFGDNTEKWPTYYSYKGNSRETTLKKEFKSLVLLSYHPISGTLFFNRRNTIGQDEVQMQRIWHPIKKFFFEKKK